MTPDHLPDSARINPEWLQEYYPDIKLHARNLLIFANLFMKENKVIPSMVRPGN